MDGAAKALFSGACIAAGLLVLFGSQSLANNATLYSKLPYNALRDLAPVVRVANTPFMLCVHPSLPVTSKQRFETLGCEPAGGTPEAFAAYFRADIEKWAKVIRDAGVRLE